MEQTDLSLFDLKKDVAEKNDLRTKLPEVYASLKGELIEHLSNVNTDYPGANPSKNPVEKNPKPRGSTSTPSPNRRSPEEFFKNRDRDSDGAITLEEFIGNPKNRNVAALTKRFKKLDSNGDDKLTLDELR